MFASDALDVLAAWGSLPLHLDAANFQTARNKLCVLKTLLFIEANGRIRECLADKLCEVKHSTAGYRSKSCTSHGWLFEPYGLHFSEIFRIVFKTALSEKKISHSRASCVEKCALYAHFTKYFCKKEPKNKHKKLNRT